MSSATTSHAGKTDILTGGCSGIGLAILHFLLSQSATVHVLDISSTPPQIPAHLPQKNPHFYPNTDVTSIGSWESRECTSALAGWGPEDIIWLVVTTICQANLQRIGVPEHERGNVYQTKVRFGWSGVDVLGVVSGNDYK
ncbi:hypothetical protein BO78DRAFT_387967 [Aspergillus sclerotiicarbonarius CBS 121057]|uniref:NAD(P)-binding protein n=1 Tax=Aspergillus sclerotiicarbonarius (strain CBS 121057 / IBT 28362) TaxID=1448318 RepID=A0A319E523_ASPSB|nr:hypothetical protein BO78DRAFT_387967 [Aspergillus sclerotiicarbonarius CBS 121057]